MILTDSQVQDLDFELIGYGIFKGGGCGFEVVDLCPAFALGILPSVQMDSVHLFSFCRYGVPYITKS